MSSLFNANYFLSEKIKVFPCAYRNSTYDATARLNTEYNFIHLPHMVDKPSYIIKFDTKELICAIQGYYFEIKLGKNDELGKDDYSTLDGKYLNICVASPSSSSGTDFIEGPHLCSWVDSDIEANLDYSQVEDGGSTTVYFFGGLQISDKELSRTGYKCYALKLDASAKLPISASKIENSAGVPISGEFTTEALKVKSSSNIALTANSDNIIANVPVTINNTLDVKTGDTSILKAESTKVAINKPTTIIGATTIKGTTKIENSSSTANDGNLTVSGTGNFGGKLAVSSGGASITGSTQITGKTTIGTDTNKTEIAQDTVTTSKITVGSLVINKNTDHILTIENKTGNEAIFYVDIESGKTYAKKINAEVEGTSANAINAANVTTSIGNASIKSIFETNGLVVQKASSLTATSSTASAGNIIITGNTTDTVDALIPAKTKGRTYNIGSSAKTFDNIYATTFHGSLAGNASTATNFSSETTVKLTGNITGTSNSSTKGWTVETTIADNAVTKTKIKDGEVTNAKLAGDISNDKLAGGITNDKLAGDISNDKLENSSITIGGSSVALGGSIGTSNKKIAGTLYGDRLNLSGDMVVNNIGNIKVKNASLKSSSSLKVVGSTVKICDSALSVTSDSVKIGSKLTITPSSGNIVSEGTVEAASFNAKSDRRLKENIIDYKPEKSILDLPIKKFDFIDGPKNQIGCIAQDLKEICPEIVNEDKNGYLSIQESKLVYLLLDEVKKLKNEVEKLKNK